MTNSNKKRTIQLGIPHGTATSKLRKMIMFKLLKEANLNWCFQCGNEIESVEDLSIEHKIPWMDSDNPKELFWDLENIAFSHLNCNIRVARRPRILKHPSISAYHDRKCRCLECKKIHNISLSKYKERKKTKCYISSAISVPVGHI